MKFRALLLAIAAGISFGSALAADPGNAPLPPEIEDAQNLGINKEPPHATLMPYATLAQALGGQRRQSPFAQSLNGDWSFHYVPRPEQRPVDFFKPDFDVSSWKTIPVPSCWQLQGYGTPYYSNFTYIFKNDPPHVMLEPPRNWTAYEERNPVGSYRRDFVVPPAWEGRRVFITFDGVDSNLFLWINGQKVGYSVNSRAPAEFDITPFLKPGQNVLAAEVYRFCAGSYLEDQDMWRLSGIFRNVTLWSAPAVHLRDFSVQPDLDAGYRDGTLNVSATVKNYGPAAVPPRSVRYQLYDRAGTPVAGAAADAPVPALGRGEERTVTLKIAVPDPAKWTAETPNLYTSVLSLGDEEILSCRTGFRKIEIKGEVFQINGVPVKLLGFNRHENEPETGHTITEAGMVRDLQLLKGCNANHVRTCHYQDDPRWYELCDEYGIYLVAESNVECHGSGFGPPNSLSFKPEWEKAFVQREVDSVERDKNHAAVIVWSLGNESGYGPNMRSALAAVKALDRTRPVHYEGFSNARDTPCDFTSNMYTSPDSMSERLKTGGDGKPFYLCEYAHAMNNSMGGLQEYLDVFDKYPGAMGGAIWEWQDQAIWNRRDPAHPFLAYGGGFGEVPNDGVFILKGGGVFADRTPNPKYAEVKHGYQWIKTAFADGKLTVRNKYAFTSLDHFTATWTVTRDGQEAAHGDLALPAVAPGGSATLDVPLPAQLFQTAGEYFLRVSYRLKDAQVWTDAGFEVATDQFKLPSPAASPPAVAEGSPVDVKEDDRQIVVSGAAFQATFDKATGSLSDLVYNGARVIAPGSGGLSLYAYRAPHQKDDTWASPEWKAAGLDHLALHATKVEAVRASSSVVQVRVSGIAEGANGFFLAQVVNYTISGPGAIAVDASVTPHGRHIVLPRIGMRMSLDPALDHFTYYGRGPSENYPDRKLGSLVGLYEDSVKNQLTPYVRPMECGNHEDVRWCALTRGKGGAGVQASFLGSEQGFSVSALPYSDEQLEKAPYAKDLPPSTATVVCLAAKTLGVGTYGCGPETFPAYRIYADPVTFSFVLRPVPTGTGDQSALARSPLPERTAPALVSRDARGVVSIGKASPGARVSYAVDGVPLQPYTAPFAVAKEARLRVRAEVDGALPFEGEFALGKFLDRSSWKITASSYQPHEGEPEHAIDGDLETFWHSRYFPMENYPHFLVIDTGARRTVSAVKYFAREGNDNGRIKDYEISVSDDGNTWGKPVASGQFQNRTGEQQVRLSAPIQARYLKLVALSECNGRPFATVADLEIVPTE